MELDAWGQDIRVSWKGPSRVRVIVIHAFTRMGIMELSTQVTAPASLATRMHASRSHTWRRGFVGLSSNTSLV